MNDEMKENEGGVFARKERAVERETAEATIPLFHGGDLKGKRKRRERVKDRGKDGDIENTEEREKTENMR